METTTTPVAEQKLRAYYSFKNNKGEFVVSFITDTNKKYNAVIPVEIFTDAIVKACRKHKIHSTKI